MSRPVTLKGEVVAEIVKGHPRGRLKAVEWGAYGELRRVEWHDDPPEQAATNDGEREGAGR